MGTPQFPDLGKHCSVEDCKQIDFLPFTCDCCAKVFCLEHRSYVKHSCPKADKHDVTVVICPLCAKGVKLNFDEDPNISWEKHVNTECDPSNYEKVTKKTKCPVKGCREILTFSNTIKCRDCNVNHCLKHRFGPDHGCSGPAKKPDAVLPFMNFLSKTEDKSGWTPPSEAKSTKWTTSLLNAASSVRISAGAGMAKLSNEIGQVWQSARSSTGGSSSSNSLNMSEECPQCPARFSNAVALVEHVQKVHETNHIHSRVIKLPVDVCPKCSKGFRDPVALVEHVERDHGGVSKA